MYRVPEYHDWYSNTCNGQYDKVGQYSQYQYQQNYNYNYQHQQVPWNNGYYNQTCYNQYPQYVPPYYENLNYNWNSQPSPPPTAFVPPKTEVQQTSMWSESVILSRILRCTSLGDLKNMRFVCKAWDEESRKEIRNRLAIRFITNRKMKAYLGKMRDRKDFCEKFVLGNGPRISLASPNTTEFFSHFGHHVRSLDVGGCLSDIKLASLRSLLSTHLPNLEELVIRVKPLVQWVDSPSGQSAESASPVPYLPKLRKLVILMDTSSTNKIASSTATADDILELEGTDESPVDPNLINKGQNFINFLHELLSAAANLEILESANLSHYQNSHLPLCSTTAEATELSDLTIDSFKLPKPLNEITEQIWSMLMNDWDVSLLKMKEICLKVKMSDECVQTMGTKWFHLTTIDLDFESTVSTKSLQFLFSSLKDSLVHVKLNFSSLVDSKDESCEKDLLPLTESMSKVKSLQVEAFKGNLRFLEFLPNLLALKFTRVKFVNTALKDVESTIKAHGSLLSFKVYEDHSSLNRQRSVQAVQQIGLLFPSLRKLRLEKLVDESLCLIYAQWPNLEELEIVEGHFTDAGTTAIHPNAYKVLLREEAYDRFNVEALRQGLYLGNLTRLRRLSLHSPMISDVTIILGAMQCPNLQIICVKSHQISDTAVQRLANKPTLACLETIHSPKLSPSVVQYAQDKLRDRKGVALINKPEANMTPLMVFEFLRKSLRPKIVLSRLPESKKIVMPNDEEEVAPSSTPEETTMAGNDVPPPSVPDIPLEAVTPVKRRKRVWPKDEEGLAVTRSKRIIIPKIVRDYYRIGYG